MKTNYVLIHQFYSVKKDNLLINKKMIEQFKKDSKKIDKWQLILSNIKNCHGKSYLKINGKIFDWMTNEDELIIDGNLVDTIELLIDKNDNLPKIYFTNIAKVIVTKGEKYEKN